MIQSMILAVSAAFCETMSPSVPSPPCGQDSEYSIPMAPAASSLRGVGLPAAAVALIVAGDRSAGRGHRQAIGPLLDQLLNSRAHAIQRMSGDVVGSWRKWMGRR